MKRKKSERHKIILSKKMIMILYWLGMIGLLIFGTATLSIDNLPYLEILLGIVFILYQLVGLYVMLVYQVPLYNRRAWFKNIEADSPEFIDYAVGIFMLILLIVGICEQGL